MKPISTKDYSVTKESFTLVYDEKFQCLKTTPKPSDTDLNRYYESDEYISHTDAKNTFVEKMYHWVRSYSLKKKSKLISRNVKSKGCVLDIGCGTGDFLKEMESKGWHVTGFEPNPKAAKIAKSKDINLMNDLIYIPDHYFDVITMWHVLEHVYDLEKQIAELKRLLKPNGLLIVAVPNYHSFDAAFYGSFWAAYDVPRHLWHFTKKSISHIFKNVDMKVTSIKPMYYDSFYVSLLSQKYKTHQMNYLMGFWIGLLSNLKGFFTKEFSSHIYLIRNK